MTAPFSSELGHGLTLGWLLVIVLAGGGLVFTALGLILAWRLKRRRQKQAKYGNTDMQMLSAYVGDDSRTRLTKRNRPVDSSSMLPTALPSRGSLVPVLPVLPPLPTYNSFGFFRGGPQHKQQQQQKQVESGMKQSTTTVFVELKADDEKTAVQQPRRTATRHHGRSRSDSSDDLPLPRPVRTSATDTDLRHILRSTEERLKEGAVQGRSCSRSPTKQLRRTSPTKLRIVTQQLDSNNSNISNYNRHNNNNANHNPHSNKQATISSSTFSRDASATSVSSATDSLLAQATHELESPCLQWEEREGGDWQSRLSPVVMMSPDRGTNNSPLVGRRRSRGSSLSSTLSTLYSVGGEEEEQPQQQQQGESADTPPTLSLPRLTSTLMPISSNSTHGAVAQGSSWSSSSSSPSATAVAAAAAAKTTHARDSLQSDQDSDAYSENDILSMLAPDRRHLAPVTSPSPAPALSSTIAELRRMNSIASVASSAATNTTTVGGAADTLADSPTLPSVFSTPAAPARPIIPRPGAIGSRHYLNIGRRRPSLRQSAIANQWQRPGSVASLSEHGGGGGGSPLASPVESPTKSAAAMGL
ncbi:hypothetical protein CP533_1082 [Ophiocordyceps camponoti-saundersi (nom. inval.)]|nr:hypothetical protein CP533_1082 [Ophiocordyceps camponoti-saundersi (nom. inval.)]